jgi:DNA-binding response OmpR family regulator
LKHIFLKVADVRERRMEPTRSHAAGTTAAHTILVVEDDPSSARVLQLTLEGLGYRVLVSGNGLEALSIALEKRPSVVILDWNLPGLDGIEVCRRLRAESDVPIIMVTGASTETDKVVGLTIGADDYVTKPYSSRELIARIQALLRRGTTQPARKVLRHRDLEVDVEAHRVRNGGRDVDLTPTEFRLLRAFLQAPERVFAREDLLQHVYPNAEAEVVDRAVDVHIVNIRKKLGDDPRYPKTIATVRGVGYKLV